jgi:hypothetical protein
VVARTVLVEIVNVALADPAGTVTLAGTETGSPLDNDTAAPPAGAVPVRITVPVAESPPTTLAVLNAIDAIVTRGVTLSASDTLVLPLSDAVIVVEPAATAATVNVALDEPAGIARGVGTVAAAGLLLASEMLAPPVGAVAVRLTVP